jgi:hypothetical protein
MSGEVDAMSARNSNGTLVGRITAVKRLKPAGISFDI